ncbi:hypothetical protein Mgra_00008745 [Meloidogyne graminicola]|uniref:ADH_zinc_N domain-containing protein n=2 Tax=Meloidogyne graminicola TaxID=189291 RepID=A0A8S9ZF09_9BILA|nr:hypothetical protein Mgra_00008745 [Meloidogyne graminicola]
MQDFVRKDYFGKTDNNLHFPVILDHEGTGIVESLGPDVEGISVGDYVMFCPVYFPSYVRQDGEEFSNGQLMNDGTSRFSFDGKEIFHFYRLSTFSEYVVVNVAAVLQIFNDSLDIVSILGCDVTSGYKAPELCGVTNAHTVAVFGLGAIGLSTVTACRARGATRIVGVDICAERLLRAEKFGITQAIDISQHDVVAHVHSHYGNGFDLCFESTGVQNSIVRAIQCTNSTTGTLCLIGNKNTNIPLTIKDIGSGMILRGNVIGGSSHSRQSLIECLQGYESSVFPINDFDVRNINIDDINRWINRTITIGPFRMDRILVNMNQDE